MSYYMALYMLLYYLLIFLKYRIGGQFGTNSFSSFSPFFGTFIDEIALEFSNYAQHGTLLIHGQCYVDLWLILLSDQSYQSLVFHLLLNTPRLCSIWVYQCSHTFLFVKDFGATILFKLFHLQGIILI
jgi:hypothetical protein